MSIHTCKTAALLAGTAILLFNSVIINSSHAAPSITDQILKQVSNQVYGKVTEVIQGAGYTYVEVDTGADIVWAAASSSPVEVGDMVSFPTNMPMKNFHSKSLNRDFPLIYFVNKISSSDSGSTATTTVTTPPHGKTGVTAATKAVEGIDKVDGGITIAEVYAGKQVLNGKHVHVRGKVTKFTAGVMGKNWLHIRDSSSLEDLTVTSNGAAAVDDIVVIKGKLALDRDFGYGYVYPLIVEDASLVKE